ncbi:MAG TPA: hypothetical protein VKU39_12350 [Streptosporangiaceae bacterium]|nr:hypothetical protein [Streptosporangiaceae bacterium]
MAPLKSARAAALAAIPVGIAVAVAVSAMSTSSSAARTVNHARPQVSAKPAPAHPATSRPAAIASPVARTVNAVGTGLFRFSPVQVFNVSRLRAGPVVIDGTSYTDSILFTCAGAGHASSGDIDYAVSGYRSLVTTVAVVSGEAGTASVSFFNNGAGAQVAGSYRVSPGHPRAVRVRFPGASQLEISCTPSTARSPGIELALANPVLSSH